MVDSASDNNVQKSAIAPTYRARATKEQVKLAIAVGLCYVGIIILHGVAVDGLMLMAGSGGADKMATVVGYLGHVFILPAFLSAIALTLRRDDRALPIATIFLAIVVIVGLFSPTTVNDMFFYDIRAAIFMYIVYGVVSIVCNGLKPIDLNGKKSYRVISDGYKSILFTKVAVALSILFIVICVVLFTGDIVDYTYLSYAVIVIIPIAISWLPVAYLYWRDYHGREVTKYAIISNDNVKNESVMSSVTDDKNADNSDDNTGNKSDALLVDPKAVELADRNKRIGRTLVVVQAGISGGILILVYAWAWSDALNPGQWLSGIIVAFAQLVTVCFVLIGLSLFSLWYGMIGLKRGKKWLRALMATVLCIVVPLGISWVLYQSATMYSKIQQSKTVMWRGDWLTKNDKTVSVTVYGENNVDVIYKNDSSRNWSGKVSSGVGEYSYGAIDGVIDGFNHYSDCYVDYCMYRMIKDSSGMPNSGDLLPKCMANDPNNHNTDDDIDWNGINNSGGTYDGSNDNYSGTVHNFPTSYQN